MDKRVVIVAGEASGDMIGSSLMERLQKKIPNAIFEGIGGPRMCALGFHSLFPMEKLSVMGFSEVMAHLFELIKIRTLLLKRYRENPPDLFLGIDAPDFNLYLEKKLKELGVKTAHYISPSIWAWRYKRIFEIKKAVDLMLCLFPFEEKLYQEVGVPALFIGHPLADQIPYVASVEEAKKYLSVASKEKVIALLPGSRQMEVKRLAALFFRTAKNLARNIGAVTFVVPAASPSIQESLTTILREQAPGVPIRILPGNARLALQACDGALVASGTATLEAMLFKKPMVVVYKVSPFTYFFAKKLVKIPYVSLPNILAGKYFVRELIQQQATEENIACALQEAMTPKAVQKTQNLFTSLHQSLRQNASEKGAQALLQFLEDA